MADLVTRDLFIANAVCNFIGRQYKTAIDHYFQKRYKKMIIETFTGIEWIYLLSRINIIFMIKKNKSIELFFKIIYPFPFVVRSTLGITCLNNRKRIFGKSFFTSFYKLTSAPNSDGLRPSLVNL